MSVLRALGIHHAYSRFPRPRQPSLRGVDLVVEPGQCWALVGPNGSGKSTLLRIAAGLTPAHAGEVAVDGHPVGSRAARARTGYVPETLSWPAALHVEGVLAELAAYGAGRPARADVEGPMRLLGLGALRRRRLGTLSLGQARRVAVAQALIDDPRLLLLDEPFGGLDSLVMHDLVAALRERLALGHGIALASHRVEDLRRLATHVLVLREGRTARAGPVDEVLDGLERRDLVDLLGAPA